MGNKQDSKDAWEKLLPRQQFCLTLYWSGLSRWKSAKRAGYRGKTKSALAHTCSFIIKKYGSEADTQEILDQCGLDKVSWAKNVLWMIRHAKAKRDLKALGTALKMAGEARLILKHLDSEGEKGATIIIQSGEIQEPKTDKKRASVVSIAGTD